MKTTTAITVTAACAVLYSCTCDRTAASTETVQMVNSGSWYETPFKWPHDGNPYETENFVVYSDAASEEARKILAQAGECLREKPGPIAHEVRPLSRSLGSSAALTISDSRVQSTKNAVVTRTEPITTG